MHKLGAFAVILDTESRVLLCHRSDMDAWNLPGGGVDPQESPWDAVIREVEEEVGLRVRVEKLLGLYSVPEQGVLAFSFLCSEIGGALGLSSEADEVAWFSLEDLPPNTLPRHVERIRDALSGSAEPILRAQ